MTMEKREGDEYKYFRAVFRLRTVPPEAEVLFAAKGHCACFLNGKFVAACTGRYAGRVNRHQVAGFLKPGINVVALILGGSYFWKEEMEQRQARGFWASFVAFELKTAANGQPLVPTSSQGWRCAPAAAEGWMTPEFDDSEWQQPDVVRLISDEEYERFWLSAPLWREYASALPVAAAEAERLKEVVGEGYARNVSDSALPEAVPVALVAIHEPESTSPRFDVTPFSGGVLRLDTARPAVVLDFGRLVVGYVAAEFAEPLKGRLRFEFDYSEDPRDFTKAAHFGQWIIEKLAVEAEFNGDRRWLNLRRRAFRYLRISLAGGAASANIALIKVKPCAYPALHRGWFNCSEPLLDEIWATARYTLRVNMQQEYESCPRNEMLAFSGDVRMDGLCDVYAHGENSLMRSFFHLIQNPTAFGLVFDALEETELWDYPAWRIICLLDYYRYSGDASVVREFFSSARLAAEWYVARQGPDGLIYQEPVLDNHHKPRIVEFTCSAHRLGRKAFLNVLVAEAFRAVAQMAVVADQFDDAARFAKAGVAVRAAVNRRLWSERLGAYFDELYDRIPQDGNALAVLFGIASERRARRALDTLKARLWSPYGAPLFDTDAPREGNMAGNRIISPLMCTYEAAARFMLGQAEDALELVRRCWGTMLRKGARTFWEFTWNDAQTRWPVPAHAWSAGPAYLLPAWVLGVRPLMPGFARVLIRPQLGNLEWARGVVPVPGGLVGVAFERRRPQSSALSGRLWLPSDAREVWIEFTGCSRVIVRGWGSSASCAQVIKIGKGVRVVLSAPGEYRLEADE